MESIKSFQWGRTQDEKASQILRQVNIQKKLDDQLKSLQAALKIFRHALNEMDGIENKKFTSISDFETFKKELSRRIHKMEKEIIEDSGTEALEEKFNFEKVITDEKFISDIKQFKKFHSVN
jgi:DNA-directed RNA polymerase beta' subunit